MPPSIARHLLVRASRFLMRHRLCSPALPLAIPRAARTGSAPTRECNGFNPVEGWTGDCLAGHEMRRSMRTLCFSIGVPLLVFTFCQGPVLACCGTDSRPLAERVTSHRAVFLGQVVSIVAKDESRNPRNDGGVDYNDYEVTLRVVRAWKPGAGRMMVVHTAAEVSTAYQFQVGHMYLVFANNRGPRGGLEVSICSPTCSDEQASVLAKELDNILPSYIPK